MLNKRKKKYSTYLFSQKKKSEKMKEKQNKLNLKRTKYNYK